MITNFFCYLQQIGKLLKAIKYHRKLYPMRLAQFIVALLLLSIQGLNTIANAADVNLIPNPSVESANSAGTLPLSWKKGMAGSNTTTFTYKTNEGNTGSKSLYLKMTNRTSGDAKWYFPSITVKPNTQYVYTGYYKSNVATEIDLVVTNTSNVTTYITAASPAASATTWKAVNFTFTTSATAKQLSIYHLLYKVGWLQNDDYSLVEVVTTPPSSPTVSITAPSAGATVSGLQTITASASDSVAIAGVQFKINGVNLDVEDTTSPYSVNWDTGGLINCSSHTLTATARNTSNLTSTATNTVNVRNPFTLAITSPANGASVNGIIPVTAAATGVCSLLGVQFKVDNVNIGAEDTNAPYSVNLNSSLLANGAHTLTALGRDSRGTTSVTASIQVNSNLIPNASVENLNTNGQAQDWSSSIFGVNDAKFTYLGTGHNGSKSLRIDITSLVDGGANWHFQPQAVTGGKSYIYTGWYQSNVETEVDAEIQLSDGSVQEYYLGQALASTDWLQLKAQIDLPANAVSITVYHLLYSPGWLITDDYLFSAYTPSPYTSGLVTIAFDDGWLNQYDNAFKLLLRDKYKLALKATFNIITSGLNDPINYMNATQVIDLHNSGMEIGSHSVTHSDMTTLTPTELLNEFSLSQQILQNTIGAPVTNFAYPAGPYNLNTLTVGKQFYQAQRCSDYGFNTKDILDLSRIKIQAVNNGTTPAEVKSWVDRAILDKTWLVLLYHFIDPATLPLPDGELYSTLPSELDLELQYIKDSGVSVVTMDQAIKLLSAQ